VTKLACSGARKATTRATSSGRPRRPSGIRRVLSFSFLLGNFRDLNQYHRSGRSVVTSAIGGEGKCWRLNCIRPSAVRGAEWGNPANQLFRPTPTQLDKVEECPDGVVSGDVNRLRELGARRLTDELGNTYWDLKPDYKLGEDIVL